MDTARRWSINTFGEYGPLIRTRVAEMVVEEHTASQDAQDASGHRSQGVYGQFWRGLIEKFEELGELPGAAMVRPGEAPYRLPVINDRVLFPWRFARSKDAELATTRFVTSDARSTLPLMRLPAAQEALALSVPDPGLTDDERDLLDALRPDDPQIASNRLILVAISSSFRGLFTAAWGEMQINGSGCIDTVGQWESLLHVPPSQPVSTSPSGSFTDGELPKKFPGSNSETGTDGRTDTDDTGPAGG